MNRHETQNGIILPIVLWVVITIIAVVATYSSIVRINILTANTIKDNARVKYIIESVVYKEIYKLHVLMSNNKKLKSVSNNIIKTDGYKILTEVMPEDMKLNINTAGREDIEKMLLNVGVSDSNIRAMMKEMFYESVYRNSNRNKQINKVKSSREIDEVGEKYGVRNLSRHLTIYRNTGKFVYSIYVSVLGQDDKKNLKAVVYSQVNNSNRIPYRIIRWES